MKIKHKTLLTPQSIEKIEEKYNVKYIGVFCIKNGNEWRNSPSAIFYQPNPDIEKGHTNYMALSYKWVDDETMSWFISDGSSAFSEPTTGILSEDGSEVVYSSYRHDMSGTVDGKYTIDGGKDYIKTSGNPELVIINVVDGKIKIKKSHGE